MRVCKGLRGPRRPSPTLASYKRARVVFRSVAQISISCFFEGCFFDPLFFDPWVVFSIHIRSFFDPWHILTFFGAYRNLKYASRISNTSNNTSPIMSQVRGEKTVLFYRKFRSRPEFSGKKSVFSPVMSLVTCDNLSCRWDMIK